MLFGGRQSDKHFLYIFIMYFFAVIVLFSTAVFFDVIITSRHGINFWHALFEGEIFHFYEYNLNCTYLVGKEEAWSAIYNIIIYFIFAIWDLPLWIIEVVFNIDVLGTIGGILWAKAIVLPFLAGSIKRIYDLCLLFLKNDDGLYVILLFLSSGYVLFTIITMGQYDIILLFLLINGTYGYCIKDNKIFLISFALAIPLKMFALFVLIALLSLKVKNIIKFSGYMLACCSLYIVTTFVPWLLEKSAMQEASALQADIIDILFVNNASFSFFDCSIFLLVIVIIYFVCYSIDVEVEIKPIWIVYLVYVVYASFCVCCPASPQWHILMCPFMVILSVYDREKRFILLLLEVIATGSIILAQGIYLNNIISANMVDLLWLSRVFGNITCWNEYNSVWLIIAEFVGKDIGAFLLKFLGVLYVASMFLFSIIALPSNGYANQYLLKVETKAIKYLGFTRWIINMVLAIMPLVSYTLAKCMNK